MSAIAVKAFFETAEEGEFVRLEGFQVMDIVDMSIGKIATVRVFAKHKSAGIFLAQSLQNKSRLCLCDRHGFIVPQKNTHRLCAEHHRLLGLAFKGVRDKAIEGTTGDRESLHRAIICEKFPDLEKFDFKGPRPRSQSEVEAEQSNRRAKKEERDRQPKVSSKKLNLAELRDCPEFTPVYSYEGVGREAREWSKQRFTAT